MSILLKTPCSHAHILSKNSPFSQNHGALMSFFSNFSLKPPCCHVHIWLKKSQFCQNYTILWAKKVNQMPFFSDFTRKNKCSHAHILSKKRTFSKTDTAPMSIFYQNNVRSLKNTVLSRHFFKFFIKNPILPCPYLLKKTRQFCQNYIILWAQKVKRMPFFSYFSRQNINSYAHIFSKKRPF